MIAGYAIYFTLPRLFGSEVMWGNYLLVVGLVSVIDNVIVTGTIQGVSKFTAQGDISADAVKRAALKVQLVLGGGMTLAYVLLAPVIADLERDASLTDYYRLSAGIMLCYAFYAVFVGSLNGTKQFGRQASLDVGFATMRAALILGFAAAGWGVFGAIGGFVSAAALILALSMIWVGLPRGSKRFDAMQVWRFMVRLFAYTLSLNLIMRVDLFLLKRLVVDIVLAAQTKIPGSAEQAADIASGYAGYYGTAQSLAFIPYQAILAVAFVIFPLISRSTFDNDLEVTRAYIRQTLRLSLVFAAGVAVVFMANPSAVIAVPYPEKYRVGSQALQVLAGGMICFSMFTIINTILNSAGRTRLTIISGVVTLAAAALSNWFLIPRAPNELTALEVAAWATSGSMALGLLLSTTLVYRAFRAAFPPMSVVRVLLAMGVAVAAGRFIPEVSKLVTLLECIAVFAIYLAVLAVLREFRAKDMAKVRRILGRR
jgi:stage V sporulation protein B